MLNAPATVRVTLGHDDELVDADCFRPWMNRSMCARGFSAARSQGVDLLSQVHDLKGQILAGDGGPQLHNRLQSVCRCDTVMRQSW